MSSCSSIHRLVTAYIDGEASTADAETVEQHLQRCEPCRGRVGAERAVHDLLIARRAALQTERAPGSLHARCMDLAADRSGRTPDLPNAMPISGAPVAAFSSARPAAAVARSRWRVPMRPLAVAASLVLVVATAFLYRMTHTSALVIARELTADHVKCFMMNAVLGTHQSPAVVESSMASSFGWHAQLPSGAEQEGLELVGARPCLYGEGRVAHIMYEHDGHPVSVFMLTGVREPEALLDVMGHQAVFWSEGERTFVLIARESEEEAKRLAAFLHRTLR